MSGVFECICFVAWNTNLPVGPFDEYVAMQRSSNDLFLYSHLAKACVKIGWFVFLLTILFKMVFNANCRCAGQFTMGGKSPLMESKTGLGHVDYTGHAFAGSLLAILSLVRLSTHSMAMYMPFVMMIHQSVSSIASYHYSLVSSWLLMHTSVNPSLIYEKTAEESNYANLPTLGKWSFVESYFPFMLSYKWANRILTWLHSSGCSGAGMKAYHPSPA